MKKSEKFITEKKAEISSVEASTGVGMITGGLVADATGRSGIKGILGGSVIGAAIGGGIKALANKRVREARKEKTPASKPKQRKTASTLKKLAGSDIRFYAGKGRGEKPDYSPSTMYHYKAHGKYTSPSLPIGSVSDKSYGKILKKEIEGPKGKKREISTGTYIRPEEAEKYIGAYDKAVKSPHPYRWYPDEAQKEVPRKRNLLEVIMRKKPTKKVVSEEGLKKFISDPEFQKEHKSTLQWMKKHKDKGFTINVG